MPRIYRHRRSLPLNRVSLVISTILLLGIQPLAPAHSSVINSSSLAWGNLFKSQPPPPPPKRGVGRGDFCLVTPSPNPLISIWSGYPTLVWRGSIEWIELRSPDNQTVLAQLNNLNPFDPNEPIHHVTYRGKPLQSGQIYTWIIKPQGLATLPPLKFQVMEASLRQQISTELKTLEAAQKATKATPETIAIQRADYFAGRQLWSDFWQTVLAVKQPSTDLKTTLESTVSAICALAPANTNVTQ